MTLTMSNGHKKDFLQWKTEQEKKGRKFYTRLSEVMQTDRDLQVGDKVMFTNDYGIVFGPHEIMAFGEPEGKRCVFLDNDSYWFADRPDQLTPVKEYLTSRYINILKDHALIKDLKVVNKECYLTIHPHISESDYDVIKEILEGKQESLTILPVRFIDEKSGFCEEVFKGILKTDTMCDNKGRTVVRFYGLLHHRIGSPTPHCERICISSCSKTTHFSMRKLCLEATMQSLM